MAGMKPAERVPLIKKIAARLAETPVDEATLVLGQFGLTPEYYVNEYDVMDTYSGSVLSVQNADDGVLLGLHEYLFGEAAPSRHAASPAAVSGIWEANMFRLFVSHTSAHKVEMGMLKAELARRGVDAFVAHDDIEPTRQWQDAIESALATCDALTAWLTPDFPASRWTGQEVGFVVARSVLIVPVRVGMDPYGFIGKYQGLQGSGKAADVVADEIVDIIASNNLAAARFIAPAAQAFARASSFNMARAAFKTLTKLPVSGWPDEALNAIERAPAENNQISEAVYDRQPLPELLIPFIAERREPGSVASPR
jgi:hypothetical protein